MDAKDFFADWFKCINQIELNNVVAKLPALYKNKIVYPEYKSIFRAFKLCPYKELKVVILGMDPYNDGAATGLAFGNRQDTKKLSPSLQVIKNCLEDRDPDSNRPFDVTLESWAKQGVLLLNSSLTVAARNPGSHSMIWRKFIASFLKGLGEWQTGIVYVLMGEQAKTFKPYIGKFNDIIECRHPSFYARTNTPMPDVFSQIDELTWAKNKLKIRWL